MSIRRLPLAQQVKVLLKDFQTVAAGLSGANDPASRGAARVLMRAIRKQLGTSATAARRSARAAGATTPGAHSAPGESPRRITGKLRRSVGTEVVGGIRRVGISRFVGRLLEEGVDTTIAVTPTGRAFGKRKRKAGTARRVLKIAPRPFMEKALANALPQMEGEAVGELQSRSRVGVV